MWYYSMVVKGQFCVVIFLGLTAWEMALWDLHLDISICDFHLAIFIGKCVQTNEILK